MINEYFASLNKGQANAFRTASTTFLVTTIAVESSSNYQKTSKTIIAALPPEAWELFRGEVIYFAKGSFFCCISPLRGSSSELRKSESCGDTVTMVLVTESLWMTEGLNEQRERRGSTRRRGYSESQTPTMVIFQGATYCSLPTTTSVQLLTEGRKRR